MQLISALEQQQQQKQAMPDYNHCYSFPGHNSKCFSVCIGVNDFLTRYGPSLQEPSYFVSLSVQFHVKKLQNFL